MMQIRIHGRGGQGVVAMAEILAIAFFDNGQIAQAFPHFGVERSGAPIQSFVRVSDQEISSREHVYEPDILVVLDDSLIGKADIFVGIKPKTKIIINSKDRAEKLLIEFKKYEDGVVYVIMQGSCSGCPSSTLTLKAGIEGMLKRMVPQVREVVQEMG